MYAWWWKHKKRNVKYRAKVKKVNGDGTYDILYDNENKIETKVPSTYMTKESNMNNKKTRKMTASKPRKMTLRGKRKI